MMPNGIVFTATDEINFIKTFGLSKPPEDRRKLLEGYLHATRRRVDWTLVDQERIISFLNMSIAQCH